MTPEMLITLTSCRTAQLMRVPGAGKPYWTIAEAGMACGGLEPEIFAAMLYSYAGADDVGGQLEQSLLAFGEVMRIDERWPATVPNIDGERFDYLPSLARIALAEERYPWRFRSAADGEVPVGRPRTVSPFYLVIAKVSGIVWVRKLADPYAALRWRYITWLSIGRAHMKRWMRREGYFGAERDKAIVGA